MEEPTLQELVAYLQYQHRASNVIEKYKNILSSFTAETQSLPEQQKKIIQKVSENFIGL